MTHRTCSAFISLCLTALASASLSSAAHSQTIAPVPFYDGFEGSALSPYWHVQTLGPGYAAVASTNGPNHGNSQLLIASSIDGTAAEVEVTIALDLAGTSGLSLGFSHKEFADEDDTKDGVWISNDGATWHKIKSLIGADGSSTNTYQDWVIDLDAAAATAGIAFTTPFYVSLQWRDNFDIPTDGFAFDDFWVRNTASTTWRVPVDFPTIQAAILGSTDGDTILVAAGIYDELVDFQGRRVSVIAEEGALATSIAPTAQPWSDFPEDPAVRFISGEQADSSLIGFTVTRLNNQGVTPYGIWSGGTSPLIKNCVISGSYAGGVFGAGSFIDCEVADNGNYNGGVYWAGGGVLGDGLYVNTTIRNNIGGLGGGVWGAPTLVGCLITKNIGNYSEGGGWYALGGGAYSCVFSDNKTFDDHSGGGVWGPAKLVNCLIDNNDAPGGQVCTRGGGVYGALLVQNCTVVNNSVFCSFPGDFGGGLADCDEVVNSVVWNNSSPMSPVGTQQIATSTVTYSVVQDGYPGIGNFASDPLLTSSFLLGPGSPAIDAGHPSYPLDADGTVTDLGYVPLQHVDYDNNGYADHLEIVLGNALDCNGNGLIDSIELASGWASDYDSDGQLDDCVAPPLNVDVNQLSLTLGGTQTFTLTSPAALSTYFLFGTTSGTSPGLSSGGFTLPLNFDSYWLYTAVNPNQPPLTNSLGVLLPTGATALFVLPPALDPALAGVTLHHAYLTLDPVTSAITAASNPVPLTLLP